MFSEKCITNPKIAPNEANFMLLTTFLLPSILKVQVQECDCVYVFIQGIFSTGVGYDKTFLHA